MRWLQSLTAQTDPDHDNVATLIAAKITTTAPLAGGGLLKSSPTIYLNKSGVDSGEYGDATHVSHITVDPFGRITKAESVLIEGVTADLSVEHDGAPVTTGTTKINFTGSNVHVTTATAGEADIAVDIIYLTVGGFASTSFITFSGLAVTQPTAGTVNVAWTPVLTVTGPGGGPVAATAALGFTGRGLSLSSPGAGEAVLALDLNAVLWAPLCTGDLPGPTLVASEDGTCIMVEIL